MSFNVHQHTQLRAKLRRRYVRTRIQGGRQLAYLEGWHVIAEANRIFGFDCWDRRTLPPRCIWSNGNSEQTSVLYATTVRITVRAGQTVVMREGVGTGFGQAAHAEVAHEIALKAAETDATKRALATFGNPFGLPLYDRRQRNVTRMRRKRRQTTSIAVRQKTSQANLSFRLEIAPEQSRTFFREQDWFDAAYAAVAGLPTLESLYTFWNANKDVFKQLRLSPLVSRDMVETFIAALKARAQGFGRGLKSDMSEPPPRHFLIPKEQRIRCKTHLTFVRTLPCLICGRQPAHAHHVKYAQQGALGLKVSDEFTVPLCALHHDSLHQAGNERSWWASQAIDPLPIAADLWATTRRSAAEEPDHSTSDAVSHTPSRS